MIALRQDIGERSWHARVQDVGDKKIWHNVRGLSCASSPDAGSSKSGTDARLSPYQVNCKAVGPGVGGTARANARGI